MKIKYLTILLIAILILSGCGGSSSIKDNFEDNKNSTSTNQNYIPKGNKLTDRVAIRFLDKATFGATTESIAKLKQDGIITWLNKQLNMPYKPKYHLRKTVEQGKIIAPDTFPKAVDYYLQDSVEFNTKGDKRSKSWQLDACYQAELFEQDQLRQRVAYALSQIIVENLAEPYFSKHAEALSAYMDIITKNALGNYKDLLLEISKSASMAVYLTYYGSRKEYHEGNTAIYPDENYAREIMQLFTIGLKKLNLDGTPKLDANEKEIPTYTQKDVNELARVFTGFDLKNVKHYGELRGSAYITHNVKYTESYHDMGTKIVLGKTIDGVGGFKEMENAIDVLISHPNIAPFISKQLIMRLATSNPTPAYVERVAKVFNDNGKGVKGDLKAVVKAIFTDREFWETKEPKKFKEPYLAYTQFLRRFHISPIDRLKMNIRNKGDMIIHNAFHMPNLAKYFSQAPTRAKTVFSFFNNDYIPNDNYFKSNKIIAPEFQIQTANNIINFHRKVSTEIIKHSKFLQIKKWRGIDKIERGKNDAYYFLDFSPSIKVVIDKYNTNSNLSQEVKKEKALYALIEHLDKKLTGKALREDKKSVIYSYFIKEIKKLSFDNSDSFKENLLKKVIAPIITFIVTSETFMTE